MASLSSKAQYIIIISEATVIIWTLPWKDKLTLMDLLVVINENKE